MLIKKLFIDASQAKLANLYRNARIKVHTLMADLYFNKQCLDHNVTPKYARLKIKHNSIAGKKTKEQAEKLFVKNMIKQINAEKDEINFDLYTFHMKFESAYGFAAWNLLFELVNNELDEIMDRKYEKLNKKLKSLTENNGDCRPNAQNDTDIAPHNFQERIINMTDVELSPSDTNVLQYGLKHNFKMSDKKQYDILATDIETNVTFLKDQNQNEIRHHVSKKVMNDTVTVRDPKQIQDFKDCLKVKTKIQDESLVVLKADKSNAVVILEKEQYITKTEDFIKENKFRELGSDPTAKYHEQLVKVIKNSKKVVPMEHVHRVVMSNPRAPVMKGIPKIHKPNVPIRPLVNFRSAPTYNISKMLSSTLSSNLNLEYKHTVKNSIDFVDRMAKVNIGEDSRIVSFDICNLYTNVPVKEVINIIKGMLEKENFDKTYINQLLSLLKTVLGQNYFRFNNRFYLQNEGLAMGSPLSAILSEVFLQHHEDLFLDKLKQNHDIVSYVRYVDDILVIFNEKAANEVNTMLNTLNAHHKNLSFTSEYEASNKINFLDLTLTRESSKLKYNIYRKPTQTNTTIHKQSVHPMSHKTASFRSMLHRAYSIPLSRNDLKQEIATIKSIAKANGYDPAIIDKIGNKVRSKIANKQKRDAATTLCNENDKSDKKYVTFHYNGPNTQKAANKFKKYNVSVAFKTCNTLESILHPNIENENKYNRSGVYKINCSDCDMSYIGQTVNFNKRFKNHTSAWRNNKPERSNVAKHLLDNGHSLQNIEENMDVLKFCAKGKSMTAWEDLFIFKCKTENRAALMNEQVNFDSDVVYSNLFKRNYFCQPG